MSIYNPKLTVVAYLNTVVNKSTVNNHTYSWAFNIKHKDIMQYAKVNSAYCDRLTDNIQYVQRPHAAAHREKMERWGREREGNAVCTFAAKYWQTEIRTPRRRRSTARREQIYGAVRRKTRRQLNMSATRWPRWENIVVHIEDNPDALTKNLCCIEPDRIKFGKST